eukprot:gb/GFBE01025785.1/.p1 GENE.gb/GFBE01025785.1/~~gb/GFBE01025785.1/.p1  ORF type:complete len:550 (+),score=85.43 gb/GFBE01025785.1/:1-1650(+)
MPIRAMAQSLQAPQEFHGPTAVAADSESRSALLCQFDGSGTIERSQQATRVCCLSPARACLVLVAVLGCSLAALQSLSRRPCSAQAVGADADCEGFQAPRASLRQPGDFAIVGRSEEFAQVLSAIPFRSSLPTDTSPSASVPNSNSSTTVAAPYVVVDALGQRIVEAPPKHLPHEPGLSRICNPSKKLTARNWSPRRWQVPAGFRLACESRNRIKNDGWKVEYPSEDRNWCWIAVKDQCHKEIKTPGTWTSYREAAFFGGFAPSAMDAPFDGLQDPEVCDKAIRGVSLPYSLEEEALARRWFNEHVVVYVLNLPQYWQRWAMVSSRLKELDINATRVMGIDMQARDMLALAKQNGWVLSSYDFSKAQARAYDPEVEKGSILGTLGCAAAHFKAQQLVINSNKTLGLVLEDDSYVMDGFHVRLWRLLTQELPCDWDVLQLLGRCAYGKCVSEHLARIQPDANEPSWRCHSGVNWGMHGILYRAAHLPRIQDLWKHTVFNESTPHCLDIDVALASISDKVNYYAVPNSQSPGLIKEMDMGSARADINMRGR